MKPSAAQTINIEHSVEAFAGAFR